MLISDFDYQLPQNRIALYPPTKRGQTNLLVLDKQTGHIEHNKYSNLIDYLNPGDVLVLNDTKVIKARLIAHSPTGKAKEFLLLESHTNHPDPHTALALTFGKSRIGDNYSIASTLTPNPSTLTIRQVHPSGTVTISSNSDLYSLAESTGQVPLPPYIKRSTTPEDTIRYQTIFATKKGSVAAPTASLNITKELINQIQAKGIKVVYLTLHVGLGTFQSIREDNVEAHHMHSEWFHIPTTTIQAITQAKSTNHSIFAVGTTVTRTLEHVAQTHPNIFHDPRSTIYDLSGEADIFIYPGFKFQVVDHLLTNFHAPRSTVLMLAAAFASWPHLKQAYQEALKHNYNFLSYGDSMLIL